MINRNRNRILLPSFIPKFSDPDIIKGILNVAFWKALFLGNREATWIFIKAMLIFKMEMFVSPIKALLRYGHGRRTIGITITVMSSLMMMAFNTFHVVGYLSTIFPLIAPVTPFILSTDQMCSMIFLDIRSDNLLGFWIIYLLLSATHLLVVYRGWGNVSVPTKRGESVLYSILFKQMGIPEYIVQRFMEPAIVGAIGFYLYASNHDLTFGIFLMIGAICLFLQECYDGIMRFTMK